MSNLFHCQNQENIFNSIELSIPPHLMCVVTLPGEISVS